MHVDTVTLQQCRFLAGPTASGKSSVALVLAERLDAEIVSLDSMAVYRGMDIGTAKPSLDDQAVSPHHLIDIVDPHEEFTLAEYVAAAAKACEEIVARSRVPLFVGGTGLYLRGVLRGVFEGPAGDFEFRRELETAAESQPSEWLHERLQAVDPESAARLHPNDHRRLLRALEVHHVTGEPLSRQQRQTPLPIAQRPRHVYWLEPPRAWLHERINRRVEQMMADGLVDEVRNLLTSPHGLGKTARQGLGYKEVIAHLEGEMTLAETIEQIQTRTRQFAKRQHTWFRNLEECTAVQMSGRETPEEIARMLLAMQSATAGNRL